MNREAQIAVLLRHGPDDVRRLALDQADDAARRSNTWGTSDHRKARDGIERVYDETRRTLERLSDEELAARVAPSV